jgi:hypothetical protein
MNISLAEFVRERAHQCCEYCRMPQIYDELLFEIDHVIAEQHRGKTVASNLAGSRPPASTCGYATTRGTQSIAMSIGSCAPCETGTPSSRI